MSKTLQQFITETTVPDHLQWKAENWDHHSEVDGKTQDKISEAMGGKAFTHFPLHTTASDADPDVVEHLANHGYQVKDYTAGIATTQKHVGDPSRGIPMRVKHVDEKIGSVLEKTGAHPSVKSAFMNDPVRSSTKTDTPHHVVISTTPLAIAGMSTGTDWTSCMNMERENRHYLEDDSKHGTHVAYLVPHDDKTAFKHGEPSKPIARIALKPFHDNDSEDTIFRPEASTYGNSNTHFTNAVAQWASANYPAKEGVTYYKNHNVYDDSGDRAYKAYGKDDVEDSINTKTAITDQGETIDSHLIDHAINYAKEKYSAPEQKADLADVGMHIGRIANLSTQQVQHVHKMIGGSGGMPYIRELAMRHGDKFSTSQIEDLAKHYDLPNKVLMSSKLPDHHIDALPTNRLEFVRKSKIKPHHVDRVVDAYNTGESGSVYTLRSFVPHLTEDHINKLAEGRNPPTNLLVRHPNLTQRAHDAMVKHNNVASSDKRILMKESKFASFEDAKKLGDNAVTMLAQNPHISDETGKKVANHFVEAADTPNPKSRKVVPSNISKHFTDDDYSRIANGKGASVTGLPRLILEDPDHSNKLLDKFHEQATEHDAKLSEHLSKQLDANEDYDDNDDPEANHLRDNLNDKVRSYAWAISDHIDNHVHASDDNGEHIKDHDEFEKTLNRMEGTSKGAKSIGSLDNYNTPDNSGRYDGQDHYEEWVAEHSDRMHDLKKNHEHWENRYDDNDY